MHLHVFETAKDFLKAAERDLARDEVRHHLLLGVAYALAAEPSARPSIFAMVRDDDGLALAALMSAPRPLLLASTRADPGAALHCLVAWLHQGGVVPRTVVAGDSFAGAFADAWQRTVGGFAEVHTRQREYVLRSVAPVRIGPGTLRQATARDLDLVEPWMNAFLAEALPEEQDSELRTRLERRLAAGEIYLWDDGEPRSMAASARPTRRGIAVNMVYTPPEWRGRGYATSSVARLSELLLSQGREFCVLYTDLANPTSNAIYTRIGYRPVGDSVLMTLAAPAKESAAT